MKQVFATIIYDIFLTSLAVFLVSFLVEMQWKGAVGQWVNLNIILVICLVAGILSILLPKDEVALKPGIGYWVGSVCISIAAGFVAYKQAEELDLWSYAFATGVALVVFFISYTLAQREQTDQLGQ